MNTESFKFVDGIYQGPEVLEGSLNLYDRMNIKSLGCLRKVWGYIDATNSSLEDLGNLQMVCKFLDLRGTKVKTLKDLHHVSTNLNIKDTDVRDLGKLKGIAGHIELGKLVGMDSVSKHRYKVKELKDLMTSIPVTDYPLHLDHENPLIRNMIKHYLETGERPEFLK